MVKKQLMQVDTSPYNSIQHLYPALQIQVHKHNDRSKAQTPIYTTPYRRYSFLQRFVHFIVINEEQQSFLLFVFYQILSFFLSCIFYFFISADVSLSFIFCFYQSMCTNIVLVLNNLSWNICELYFLLNCSF